MINYIDIKMRDVIADPFHNFFENGLAKAPLKLGFGGIITTHA